MPVVIVLNPITTTPLLALAAPTPLAASVWLTPRLQPCTKTFAELSTPGVSDGLQA